MSQPKYSPTPWNVAGDYIRSKATRYVGFVNLSDNATRRQANAARICACVNACEGISDEALESGVLAEMEEALDGALKIIEIDRNASKCKIDCDAVKLIEADIRRVLEKLQRGEAS